MGKGLTIIRSLRRKHYPDMQDWSNNANHIAGNSTEGKTAEEVSISQSVQRNQRRYAEVGMEIH